VERVLETTLDELRAEQAARAFESLPEEIRPQLAVLMTLAQRQGYLTYSDLMLTLNQVRYFEYTLEFLIGRGVALYQRAPRDQPLADADTDAGHAEPVRTKSYRWSLRGLRGELGERWGRYLFGRTA
jgi:hypothetical protein